MFFCVKIYAMGILKQVGEDIKVWFEVLSLWAGKRIREGGQNFEGLKNALVDFLMAKRGLRQRPFLHFGVAILMGAGLISAPLVAVNYPLISQTKSEPLDSPSAVLNTQTAADIETVTEESVKPRDKIIIYKVQKGDTVSLISQQFGISTDTIRWANDLKDIKDIKPDQELKILPVSGVMHKVSKGETIYKIADKYKANAQAIVDFPFNEFIDLTSFTLAIGTTVIVPDGVKPEEKPWSPPKPVLGPIYAGGGTGQFIWPTSGSITQGFSWYHPGIDIANRSAPAVLAADDGVVTLSAKESFGYGWHIIIDHGNGYKTLYGHMQALYANAGDRVSRGQTIGQMGSTGRSTGTHTHFEIWKDGKSQSPLSYLK